MEEGGRERKRKRKRDSERDRLRGPIGSFSLWGEGEGGRGGKRGKVGKEVGRGWGQDGERMGRERTRTRKRERERERERERKSYALNISTNTCRYDHINRNAPLLIRTAKLTRFEPA